jgi:hypothetical protein
MRFGIAVYILTLGALVTTPGLAQAPADPPEPAPKKFCFRGRPAPACTGFAIIEFGGALGAKDGEDGISSTWPYVERQIAFWELGLMRNLGTRSAIGGTLLLTSRFSVGIKARYRHWLGREFSVDLAPGLTVYDERNYAQVPAFTGHLTLNYGDWISVGGMLETSRFGPAPFLGEPAATVTKPFLTARIGSYPGLIGVGASGLVLGLVGLVLLGGGY